VRIAVVSDIHGNRAALEAVIADLETQSPDLILHGGDLADGGSSPAWVVDCIRDLNWPGVYGNADEMLWRPQSLEEFLPNSPLLPVIQEGADHTREALGAERLRWLANLPLIHRQAELTLFHASLDNPWRTVIPPVESLTIFAHTHVPSMSGFLVNTGSISLSYDGDPRSSYLLIDGDICSIRRVAYNIEAECRAMEQNKIPNQPWITAMLQSARFILPG